MTSHRSRRRLPIRLAATGLALLFGATACAGPQLPQVGTAPAPTVAPTPAMFRGDPRLPQAVVVAGMRLQVAQLVPDGVLYSGFGTRASAGGGGGFHRGIDISAPSGTPVHAAAAGEVVEIGRNGAYGRLIRIRHSPHLETVYAHLSGFAPGLTIGRMVAAGDPIGRVGRTGNATGPHLHFEIRRDNRPVDPLDQPAATHES